MKFQIERYEDLRRRSEEYALEKIIANVMNLIDVIESEKVPDTALRFWRQSRMRGENVEALWINWFMW